MFPIGERLHTDYPSNQSITVDLHRQALERLIGPAIPQDELPSVIEAAFSGGRTADVVDHLRGDDAQTFVDVIDGVRRRAPSL